MEKNYSELLEERIVSLLSELESLKPGTDEYRKVSDVLEKLYKLKTEEDKMDSDVKLKERQLATDEVRYQWEHDADQETRKREKIFAALKLGVEVVGLVGGYLFYGTWLKRGFRFEESGAITSQFTKGFFKKIEPKK